jgi:predicted alpha-1,2-mannosidase
MKIDQTACLLLLSLLSFSADSQAGILWQIGESDNSTEEFSLAPGDYKAFLPHDFGWEDKYFLIGTSVVKEDWPYVLPGPSDQWGGTWSTSGWRSHTLNILFGLQDKPDTGPWKLVVDIMDSHAQDTPLFKVTLNGRAWKFKLPGGSGNSTIEGTSKAGKEYLVEIPVENHWINAGGNQISLTILEGSWLLFDQIRLEGPEDAVLLSSDKVFVRSVAPAEYEMETEAGLKQPLLVDVEHLSEKPLVSVVLDGQEIFKETVETGRYVFEAPMDAVASARTSPYKICVDGKVCQSGLVERRPHKPVTLAEYADTMMGTAHSRWMIAPGPWMPFSMVKLSPDNQNGGWQAGYDPIFESIGGFSHIHEWTMSGLSLMPANGPLKTQVGDQKDPDSGYRSRINKETEQAPIGYYRAQLTDYHIEAELTATTRCGFHRYTFPADRAGARVLIDLQSPAEYGYNLEGVYIRQISDHSLEGYSKQLSPNTWSGGISQEYIVHFAVDFDQPIRKIGFWTDQGIQESGKVLTTGKVADAGAFIEFDTTAHPVVQVRTGLSYVSLENARRNLDTEIVKPFGWSFDSVRQHNLATWNDIFNRVKITSHDRREKKRFYSNMYRAICSRNIFSDVNGQWVDAAEKIQQLPDPESVALGCDAFWNTFWNLNQFWNLATPDWSSRWVKSQLAMYDANGWLAKGPAGMEYIPVMVAEHEIPLLVSAYQMGIRDYDADKAFEAVKKMQTTPAREVGGGFAGNRDLEAYLKYRYVPYDKGRFSNSLEYSFDDWTVSQFARALGRQSDYDTFLARGNYWKNVIDKESGYARMKKSDGTWFPDFDPYQSGRNHHYVEGNAWQLTFFVPQDVTALAREIGVDRFRERLNWGFEESNKVRFNAPNDQYWDYPVVQGNQQSMHFAFLFNWVSRPWLTQKWSRAICDRYYGYGLSNAYLGDEDQGQMSAWFIMATLGLFQTDGGCRADPIYEIGSPLYERVEIDLGHRYGRGATFVIKANNASRLNKYVQAATLNGKPLQSFSFPAKELLKGGSLELDMGPEPNYEWGVPSQGE